MQFPMTFKTSNSMVRDVAALRREMDRWFDGYWDGSSQSLQPWAPAVSIQERPDSLAVTAELPGVNAADVEVTVENGVLTISGEKNPTEAEGNVHLDERRYGRFERSFTLLQSVVADDIRADFANGVLTVSLPKTAEAKPRRIQIESVESNDRNVGLEARR